ncbi:carbon-nitrogen hydrolase [Nemania sp. NC0429]|nr:carbon-nitrogen hydrolase [Nemania sp. NC0429]
MRIGCLQFAPQVGDIDNNLNRADAVLNRKKPEDLDLLVLPELAFTGYNFKSLRDISPFLEHRGSGISAVWARTVALKYNCLVSVGYPEQVDVRPRWPASPEYYNSVIVVNQDGETIANYRKTFLYYTDETWALEGTGFYTDIIPELGSVSMGICMDINPYKFETPWHAFEFAHHCVEVKANVVIVTMAWLTHEGAREFSRTPNEPDMASLTYWIGRLEPLIRSEPEEEVIVIFCNRCGVEDGVVYAGTSTVVGIKDGEVSVYGMLGRGEKELLVVDTEEAPVAKLIFRPDDFSVTASDLDNVSISEDTEPTYTHETANAMPPPIPVSPNKKSEGATQVNAAEYEALLEEAELTNLPHSPVSQNSHPRDPPKGHKAQAPPIQIPQRPGETNTIPTSATAPNDTSTDSPNRFFRIASESLLRTPHQPVHARADSPTISTNMHTTSQAYTRTIAAVGSPIEQQVTKQESGSLEQLGRVETPGTGSKLLVQTTDLQPHSTQAIESGQSPSAPSRTAAHLDDLDRSGSPFANRPDWAAIAERLDALAVRPESAAANNADLFPSQSGSNLIRRVGANEDLPKAMPSRPYSPKSRNASVSRAGTLDDPLGNRRKESISRASVLNADPAGSDHASRVEGADTGRPQSRAQSRGRHRVI